MEDKKSAKIDGSACMANLAICYEEGIGTEVDLHKARLAYTRAFRMKMLTPELEAMLRARNMILQSGARRIDDVAGRDRKCGCCGKAVPEGNLGLKCGGCQEVYYCSEECVKADWKRHKKECAYWRAQQMEKHMANKAAK